MLTNENVQISGLTDKAYFLKEFQLIYKIPDYDTVLDVNITNYDFSGTSVILKLQEIKSNTFVILVKNYELSNYIIPGLQVRALSGGITNEFFTPAFPVTAHPLSIAVSNKAPLEDIYHFRDFTIIIILAACVILALLSFFIIRFLHRKKENQIRKAAESINPFDEALQKLEEIRGMKIRDNNHKEIFSLLSEIVRRFFERIFMFPALELSTSEILKELKTAAGAKKLSDDFSEISYHIFRMCDRVKYAKHVPDEDHKVSIIEEARDLVFQVKKADESGKEEAVEKEGENP